ncbi:unnamed protein product [Sphagnum balticum]
MDPSFLFAGVRFDRKRFAADVNRFKNGLDTIASSNMVESTGVQKKKKKKKRKLKHEDESSFNIFKPPEVNNDKSEQKPGEKRKIPEAEFVGLQRKKYRIHVAGHNIPAPLLDFDQLKTQFRCKSYLMQNIANAGYREPTPIQRQVIPVLLAGRECFACAPTGSGKTLAFLLPILMRLKVPSKDGVRAVILCPTRELALQTTRELKKLIVGKKFRVRVMTKALARCSDFSKLPCDILVSTPLRLDALLKESKIDLGRVEHLVMDESDKLFEMGFVEQIDAVVASCTHPSITRSLFSATLPDSVEELARTIMHDAVRIVIGERNSAAQTVKQRLVFVGTEEGKLLALRQIFKESLQPPVLIFVQSKERAQELHRELENDDIKVDSIHADRTQAQRDAAVEKFREGKTWVLIATDLLGRGMDFKGVNVVINYDFPHTSASYIHRVGRSGRAGRSGQAITLYTEEDVPLLHSTAHIIQASGCEVPGWMLSLPKGPKRKAPTSREAISTRPPLEAKVFKRKSNKPLKVKPVPDAKGTNENQVKSKKSRKVQHISDEGVLT